MAFEKAQDTKKPGENIGGGGSTASLGVGTVVLYQPTDVQWPTGYYQHAAVVTGWNEDTQVANLLVFPDSQGYTVAKNQVKEGTDDGTFQQVGTDSKRVAAIKAAKKQAEEEAQKAAPPPPPPPAAATKEAPAHHGR